MIDLSSVRPIDEMCGESPDETAEFAEMYERAQAYMHGFAWCKGIRRAFFGGGIAGVVAVFLFHIEAEQGIDPWLWTVEGDLPSAYLVSDDATTPGAALEVYCRLMQDWVDAVKAGESLDDVFPVSAPADSSHAEMLAQRVRFLRERVIPALWPRHA